GVSAGSKSAGASVKWRAQVIWPAGASAAGAGEAARQTRARMPAASGWARRLMFGLHSGRAPPARTRGILSAYAGRAMKLGTSLRFLFPTSPQTHETFRRALATAPPGSFIERPMGAYDTAEQARNWLEVAAAARAAGLDGLLVGDNHAVPAAYA